MSFTIEGHNPIERACSECKGSGTSSPGDRGKFIDPDYCDDCGGSGLEFVDLACLLHNLAIAGALEASFWLAWHRKPIDPDDEETPWRPGCGQAAP